MINRGNWKAYKAYLKYLQEVKNLASGSVRMYEGLLRHLLIWAGNIPFEKVPNIRPSFPKFIVGSRLDGKDKTLSPAYVKKAISTAKRFFHWLSLQRGYAAITSDWLNTLEPPRMPVEPKKRDVVTLEYVRALANAPVASLREQRIRASAVFWFLSGIRIGAFVTLPLKAVNIQSRVIHQWPKWGVKTKNNKHATTHLLNMPDLLEVVRAWDTEVKGKLSIDGLWFAPFDPETLELLDNHTVGDKRSDRARKDFKEWVTRIGFEYYSPKEFRHGYATYSISNCVSVADLKAVSQNMMHSNLSITDGIYAILTDDEVGERVSALGENVKNNQKTQEEKLNEILEFIETLKK